MQASRINDTESLIDECINFIGGVKVNSLFAKTPDFDNADYYLENYNIIAELKCLQDDKSTDKKFINKIKEKFREHLKKEKMHVFGTILINSNQVSKDCSKEIQDIFRKPIQDITKKANKQIRETKQKLNKDNAHGLLILINDNNKLLEPSFAVGLIGECLRRDGLSSIDSVLYLMINMTAIDKNADLEAIVGIECTRNPSNKCNKDFYTVFQKTLLDKLEVPSDKRLRITPKNHGFLEELKIKGQKELFLNFDE